MKGLGGLVERFTERFNRNIPVISGEISARPLIREDPSEDLEFFLAPGKIEELVAEGRIPLRIGVIGSVGEEMQPYYQVPPRGFDPTKIERVYMSAGGCYSFVYKDGTQRIGSTYTLTGEQARQVEERIAAVCEIGSGGRWG